MRISIVIPVYNGSETVPLLVRKLSEILPGVAEVYEVLLVNDGSRDQSWDTIQDMTQKYPWVSGINLMRNYGQHNALLCGIRSVQYDIVVTMDDDLQHPPEEIPSLLAKLEEGFDVVYGKPQREQHGLWRDLASQITKLALQSAIGSDIARKVSAFRVFRTQLRDAFAAYRSPFVSIDVLLTWGTTRFSAIPVRHLLRPIGKSNYTFRKLVGHALNMMTGYSALPLQFASLVGFAFTLFGLAVFIFVFSRYLLYGGTVPGFAFLASIIAIFSGAQLFALGIVGEYLARMHFRMMERPPYTVRQRTLHANRIRQE